MTQKILERLEGLSDHVDGADLFVMINATGYSNLVESLRIATEFIEREKLNFCAVNDFAQAEPHRRALASIAAKLGVG